MSNYQLPFSLEIKIDDQIWTLNFQKSYFKNKNTTLKIYQDRANHVFIFIPDNTIISQNLIQNLQEKAKELILNSDKNIDDVKPSKKKKIFINRNSTSILLFGKTYSLKFIESTFDGCVLGEKELKVFYKKTKNPMLILKNYLIKELNDFITPIHNKYLLNLKDFKIDDVPFQVVYSYRWWGINIKHFNKFLIKYNVGLIVMEPKFIETVIVHEISHLYHRNHSKQFKLFGESLFKNFIVNDLHINDVIYYWSFDKE